MYNELKSIQNANGGGLSVAITGQYTSIRHALAKAQGKLTAGQTAKELSKLLKIKILAKEITEGYLLLKGHEPEWHHSGFYKGSNGRKTMGRTFFFTESDFEFLLENWNKIEKIKSEILDAAKLKQTKEIERQKFFKKYGIPFNRLIEIPKFGIAIQKEMYGKFGWFPAQHKYSLTIYYSGFYFKSKRTYEKYINCF